MTQRCIVCGVFDNVATIYQCSGASLEHRFSPPLVHRRPGPTDEQIARMAVVALTVRAEKAESHVEELQAEALGIEDGAPPEGTTTGQAILAIRALRTEVERLRQLLSRIHEDALYKNECAWCHEDPADEHERFLDEDGDSHPCFGQDVHDAIVQRSTSAKPDE